MAKNKNNTKMQPARQREQDDTVYPPLKKVLASMAAIWLAFFVVALDRTIIGTAIPTISKQFNSFGDIAWYESGFLLPLCVLQLSFGRIYKYYSTKWIVVINVVIFEIGSVVCAAAPNSQALIIGRVITGIGGAGIPPGAFLLVTTLVPLQERPKYLGALGSVFGLTSILGPILGGYLTAVSWRWCFWINLPIGGVAIVLLLLLTPSASAPAKRSDTWKGRFLELDPLGFALIAPCLVCLLLAIEFGGSRYPWNSGTVIALFVLFGVLGIGFIATQIWQGEKGTTPPHIFLQRSILSGSIASIGIGSCLIIYAFYLPIWFQAIQGKSPQNSGLALIPLLLSVVFAVILSGIFSSKVGYYTPPSLVGAAILIVGAGLISTWSADVKKGSWIGYQIITGIGLGLTLQGPNIAVQAVLPKDEVSIGIAIVNLFSFLGGSIFVTAGQALLEEQLIKNIRPILPNIDPASLANGGATTLRNLATPEQLPAVLVAYNDAIRNIWYLGLGLACLVLLATLGFEWKSVKEPTKRDAENGEAKVDATSISERQAGHSQEKDEQLAKA